MKTPVTGSAGFIAGDLIEELLDVRRRVPSVEKARRVLGFEATTSLSEALDEIIPWAREQVATGGT
jgi:nucleoside-diphosphate-sugar epimerase